MHGPPVAGEAATRPEATSLGGPARIDKAEVGRLPEALWQLTAGA